MLVYYFLLAAKNMVCIHSPSARHGAWYAHERTVPTHRRSVLSEEREQDEQLNKADELATEEEAREEEFAGAADDAADDSSAFETTDDAPADDVSAGTTDERDRVANVPDFLIGANLENDLAADPDATELAPASLFDDDPPAAPGPGDTGAYLTAALESKQSSAGLYEGGTVRKDRNRRHNDDLKRYTDVSSYRHRRLKQNRSRTIRIVLLAVLAVVLVVGFGVGVYISNINAKLTENVTPELREQLVEKEASEPFYLLLLGVDKDEGRVADTEHYGADEHAYRSDSIMLCRIDPQNVKVTMVSIHRDTMINMDDYGVQKINASYAFGGPAYTTKIVAEFADVPISHYAEVDLDRFIAIVDQVGGVTVDLPVPVKDPEYTGLDLPAGVQTLNGTDAALLCRCRHGYDAYGDGDRYRAANQRMVFSEIIKKVLASDPATMAATVATMAESVTTDLAVGDILELATQMYTLDVENDIMTGMEPTDGVFTNNTWYEQCLVDQWRTMMTRVNQGLPPLAVDKGEYDSTAGVAGGVGNAGAQEAISAIAADAEAAAEENGTEQATEQAQTE